MPLTIGPAFTIPGYTTIASPDHDNEYDAPVHGADDAVRHPAFWFHYLSDPLGKVREAERAFQVARVEYDAMLAALCDPERWLVISVRLAEDRWLRIVYRNLEEEMGLDFVEQRPDRPVELVASVEGHGFSSAMTWAELLAAAALPDDRLTWAQRLMLMLPMLGPQELPDDAGAVVNKALEGIGAGNRTALTAALLDRLDWRTHQQAAD
ncbi:hypothetical protein [Micromonospora sp. CB01531]|uniref:hypothetical protein n=1 Tax=Micromonospora sp. CB01531 TaxID=1718947 RepID=UPI0011612065|nr:hypothetical protein [Micromonospora sp. CB01531]